MSKPLVIFGTGSLARMAHYYATQEMELSVLGFAVDDDQINAEECCGLPVLNWKTCTARYSPLETSIFIAVGYKSMPKRQILFERIKAFGYPLENIISSSAFVAETSQLGENNIVMPGVVI